MVRETLDERVVQGGMWLAVGTGAEQGLRFLRNVILARVVLPDAFGLLAIVVAINGAVDSFSEAGVRYAIVQDPKGDQREYLNGAWWVSFGRAIAVYGLAFLGAPFIAGFYESKELTALLRVAFLSIPLNGLMSPGAFVALKHMKFRRWVFIEQGGGIIGVLTSVLLGLWLQSVWALVIGFTVESAARCIFSYVICPFRPGIRLASEPLRSLLKFSRGMLGLPILTFIFMRADIFVVGKLCSPAELGVYSMGIALARTPFAVLNNLITRLIMPVFSSLQKDEVHINHATIRTTLMVCLLGFPPCFFVLLYGREMLSFVYGAMYRSVAVPFAITFVTELLGSSSIPIATFYVMSGRPELHRLFTAVRAICVILLIIPAVTEFGLVGAASAVLFSMIAGYVVQVRRMNRITGLNLTQYLGLFLRSAGVSSCVLIMSSLGMVFFPALPGVLIGAGIVGLFMSYGLGMWLLKRSNGQFSLSSVSEEENKESDNGQVQVSVEIVRHQPSKD